MPHLTTGSRRRYRLALLGGVALSLSGARFGGVATAGTDATVPHSQEGAATCDASPTALAAQFTASRGGAGGAGSRERMRRLVDETFALQEIARAVYPGAWDALHPRERSDLADALGASIAARIADAASGSEARADAGDPLDAVFATARRVSRDGACRVVDLSFGDRSLVEAYRDRVRTLIDDYSLAYAVAKLGDRDRVVLEDFETSPVGGLPEGWDWKDSDDGKEKPYRIAEEDGNRYLEARDEGQSVILGKEIRWDLEEYPYISFRIRVLAIPEGGDERYDDTVDSAAGLYVTYDKKMFGKIPESVKFVWSSTLPVGAATIREGIGRPWQVVIGSGEEGLGQWHTFTFDLRETYKKTFRGDPPDRPLGIGILSDANSTNSRAWADYDDIVVLRDAPPGVDGGVSEVLRPRRRQSRR